MNNSLHCTINRGKKMAFRHTCDWWGLIGSSSSSRAEPSLSDSLQEATREPGQVHTQNTRLGVFYLFFVGFCCCYCFPFWILWLLPLLITMATSPPEVCPQGSRWNSGRGNVYMCDLEKKMTEIQASEHVKFPCSKSFLFFCQMHNLDAF